MNKTILFVFLLKLFSLTSNSISAKSFSLNYHCLEVTVDMNNNGNDSILAQIKIQNYSSDDIFIPIFFSVDSCPALKDKLIISLSNFCFEQLCCQMDLKPDTLCYSRLKSGQVFQYTVKFLTSKKKYILGMDFLDLMDCPKLRFKNSIITENYEKNGVYNFPKKIIDKDIVTIMLSEEI